MDAGLEYPKPVRISVGLRTSILGDKRFMIIAVFTPIGIRG